MAQQWCFVLLHTACSGGQLSICNRFIIFDTRQTQKSLVDKTNFDASIHVVSVEAVAIFVEIGTFKVERVSWLIGQTNSDHGQENCGQRNRDFDKKSSTYESSLNYSI
jgi:hypothetical protein